MSYLTIVRKPSVYLLGRQTFDEAEMDRFLGDHGVEWHGTDTGVAAEKLCEVAGRVCYMSFSKPRPGGNKAYLENIISSLHGSVTEHAVFTFLFTGVSRSLTHELVRHRLASYSQLSQRYVDETDTAFVEPDAIAEDLELHAIWVRSMEVAQSSYVELADLLKIKFLRLYPDAAPTELRKAARQAARSVLPNATETKICVTMNCRAIRHFLEQRGSRHAEPEIRKLANAVYDVVRAEAPNLFSDYTRSPLPDGSREILSGHRKV